MQIIIVCPLDMSIHAGGHIYQIYALDGSMHTLSLPLLCYG